MALFEFDFTSGFFDNIYLHLHCSLPTGAGNALDSSRASTACAAPDPGPASAAAVPESNLASVAVAAPDPGPASAAALPESNPASVAVAEPGNGPASAAVEPESNPAPVAVAEPDSDPASAAVEPESNPASVADPVSAPASAALANPGSGPASVAVVAPNSGADPESQAAPDRTSSSNGADSDVPVYVTAMMSSISKIESRLAELSESVNRPKTKSTPPVLPTEAGITYARDLDSIMKLAPDLVSSPALNCLHCKVCLPDFIPEHEAHNAKSNLGGLFRYNFDQGTSFSKSCQVPRAFSALKDAIKSHLSGKRHMVHVERKNARDALNARREQSSARAAKNVLRVAYHVVKDSLPHSQFEKMIVTSHKAGARMGDLCHSSQQMQRFRKAFHKEVMDCLSNHVGSTPCVALVVDKVTIMHRTMDITGIITIIPAASPQQLFQSFVVGAPVVKSHDGMGLAEEWLETVKSCGLISVEQLSAMSTDGQYHHGGVPARFLKLSRESEEDYAQRTKRPCVPCLWDGAHLLQLADGDARKGAGSGWVKETVDIITRVNKRFSHGKAYESFRDTDEALGGEARGILLWSDTRFAPHAANVMKAFICNQPVFVADMEKHLESGDAKSSAIAEMHQDIKMIRGW